MPKQAHTYPEETRRKLAASAFLTAILATRYLASGEAYAAGDANPDAARMDFIAAQSLSHATRLLLLEGGDTLPGDERQAEMTAASRIETRVWEARQALERRLAARKAAKP